MCKRFVLTVVCAGTLAVSLAVSGCATFWDDVTSRNFSVKAIFVREDPLVVLRDSDDGSKRARALETLEEPLAKGGSQQDQDVYVKILTSTALTDRDLLCRLAAVRALGRFKDQRAAETLRSVYFQNLPFSAEMNTLVRQQVLTSLAQTRHESARELLVRVAKEPPAEGSMQDRQETLDRRLNAIRGLGDFNHYESTDALLHILKSEKDAALRERAHESLRKATGKNAPADAIAWERILHPGSAPASQEPAGGPMHGSITNWIMRAWWQQ